jgi:hypothetical protein
MTSDCHPTLLYGGLQDHIAFRTAQTDHEKALREAAVRKLAQVRTAHLPPMQKALFARGRRLAPFTYQAGN